MHCSNEMSIKPINVVVLPLMFSKPGITQATRRFDIGDFDKLLHLHPKQHKEILRGDSKAC